VLAGDIKVERHFFGVVATTAILDLADRRDGGVQVSNCSDFVRCAVTIVAAGFAIMSAAANFSLNSAVAFDTAFLVGQRRQLGIIVIVLCGDVGVAIEADRRIGITSRRHGAVYREPVILDDSRVAGAAIHRRGDGVIWFEFEELCEKPRGSIDFIEIARAFNTVVLSNMPRLRAEDSDAARRFVIMVDEFYDRNVKLLISAAVPIKELYLGKVLEFEFQRTVSRLTEMQSHDYLARPHLP